MPALRHCRLPLLWLLACALSLIGCEKPATPASALPAAPLSQSRKVVFLSAHGDLPFKAGQRHLLMRLAASDAAATLEYLDASGDARLQMEQMTQAMAARPFAILLDPVEGVPLAGPVAEAVSRGGLVIGLGSAASSLPCSTTIFCDEQEIGKLAGNVTVRALARRAEAEDLPEVTGRVVEIRGDDESARCQQRHEGFAQGLRSAPGLILVHDAPGGWTKSGGAQRMQDAIRLQKQFDVVFAHNDLMALGAAEAAGEMRGNVLLIGVNGFTGPDGGFTAVNNGDIDATIHQPLLVDLAWQMIRKKLAEPNFEPKQSYKLQPTAITPKDVDDIRRKGLPPLPEL